MTLAAVLVSPRNPLNIGAAARAMANFGCFDLRLVQAYRNAVDEARSATHAGAVLRDAREFATLAEAIADCSLVVGTASLGPRESRHEIVRLEQATPRIQASEGRTAIVFGSEKSGLSNDDLAHCHWLMTIPSDPNEHGSMNLGQAVAVCFYELAARGTTIPQLDHRTPAAKSLPADGEAEDRLTQLLIEALTKSGYVHERTLEGDLHKLQRLVKRMQLSRRDAEIWQGVFRQILWRISNPESKN